MKVEELRAMLAAEKKPSKYRSRKVEAFGLKFDSTAEANRWGQLLVLERLGHIQELRRQVVFQLAPPVKIDGEKRARPALRYIADFAYVRDGSIVVEDVKGVQTETFRVKQHLMKAVHGIDVLLTRRSRG